MAVQEMYLHTEHLAVGYEKIIIEEIEIAVNKGEILTLIGPNGAGKSTILKTITRQLSPHRGTIWIDRNELKDLTGNQVAKKMAVVMTKRVQPELMTCEDVVATGRYPYTGRFGVLGAKDREIVWQALRMVQAESLAEVPFDKISDGQRQRIMLAKAICQEPEVIVLDEPTSYLDIKHKIELLYILKHMVQQKKIAVIMSLHELELAQRISDKIVCVGNGKIQCCGTVEEIFHGDYITKLYGIEKGSFYDTFGTVELWKIEGEPKVFIIGGGGSGIAVYRKLQRKGIPFVAGVLHENDVEYEVAKALGTVIGEKAFEEISMESYRQAVNWIEKCDTVICTIQEFGTMNKKNKELLALAEDMGKVVTESYVSIR